MTAEEYFARMKALGYPRPGLSLWLNAYDELKGSASYAGTAGYGGTHGVTYATHGELIAALFAHVTKGGKSYAEKWV